MEQAARSGRYEGKLNILLVNLASKQDAEKFARQRGIHACQQLVGRPSSEYGLRYIPHKVLIDGEGKVVQNFNVDWATVDKLALA